MCPFTAFLHVVSNKTYKEIWGIAAPRHQRKEKKKKRRET